MKTSSQKYHSPSLIRPIKCRHNKDINQHNIAKYRVSRPKNLKTRYSPLFLSKNQPIKKSSKVFETQDVISSASYSLNDKSVFQNAYFSSRIRNMSTSLSSFCFLTWYQIPRPRSQIFKSFNFLKNLDNFDIFLHLCQFSATNGLHSLFRRLLYFKKMTKLTFHTACCEDFQKKHLNALCSSLIRSSRLQYLNLGLEGDSQLMDVLIPALSKLTFLKGVGLYLEFHNSILAEHIIKLFKALGTIQTLTDITLSLYNIDYEETGVEPIAKGLQYLNASSVRKLNLYLSKNLTNKDFLEISQALSRFTSLEIFRLGIPYSEKITNEGLQQLSLTISSLGSLTSLDLALPSFPENLTLAFQSLKNLASLKLSFQNEIQPLSSSLKALRSSLKFLEINFPSQSPLSEFLVEDLAETFKELTLLKHLSLYLKFSSAQGIQTLIMAIQGLSNLSSLALFFGENQGIDDHVVKVLSQTLQRLPSLHSIELDLERCDQIDSEGNGLRTLFTVLVESKNIFKLRLILPLCCKGMWETIKGKKRLNFYFEEDEDQCNWKIFKI